MSKITTLRTLSSGELRSRIPALERAAASPSVGERNAARADLNRVQGIIEERETARRRADDASKSASTAWERVTELESQLAEARAEAQSAERESRAALRVAWGQIV